jgi:hypothetical protein
MRWLVRVTGATALGAIGWWVGSLVGTGTAFIVSLIGTGLGAWGAQRYLDSLGL